MFGSKQNYNYLCVMVKFGCTKCGACCKRIKKTVEDNNISKADFPYKFTSKGACTMLKDRKCTVYENRPLICNVDKFIEVFGLDKEHAYAVGIKECNELIRRYKLPDKYLIQP